MKLIYNVTIDEKHPNGIGTVTIHHDGKVEDLHYETNMELIDKLTQDMCLWKNAVQCHDCKETIESKFTHDFVQCSCKGTFVDGGHSYNRWGAEKGCILKVIYNTEED